MPRGIYKDKTKYVGGKKGRKSWKLSEDTKRKIGIANTGENAWNWKNGISKTIEGKRMYDNRYVHGSRKIRKAERRKNEPKFRMDEIMGRNIWHALKGKKAGRKWEELTGYKVEDLVIHLEKQFDDNMDWDNYGNYWSIDHIKPKSLFRYERPEDIEFKKCWSLENLQPMEKIANIKKGNKYYDLAK